MFWRQRPPRDSKQDDATLFLPAIPIVGEHPPAGPEWHHEVKHDGIRMLARKDGAEVRLWTRENPECVDDYRLIAAALEALPVANCIIDGEAVRVSEGGRSDRAALDTAGGRELASLVCFDLVELGAASLRHYPIEERRTLLFSILGEDPDTPLVLNEVFKYEGEEVLARACALGLEGIVSKRRESLYRSGSNPDWVVTRNPGYRGRA